MTNNLDRALQYKNASREELLAILEKLFLDKEIYSDKIAQLTLDVSLQRIEGYNDGYRMGFLDCWRKFHP